MAMSHADFGTDATIRALRQENEELRKWLKSGTYNVENARRGQDLLLRDVAVAESESKTNAAKRERVAKERDEALKEVARLKEKERMTEDQVASFVQQIRRMRAQCRGFREAIREHGVSAGCLLRLDNVMTNPPVDAYHPGSRAPVEAGRDALLELHQQMGDLMVTVRQAVARTTMPGGGSPRHARLPSATSSAAAAAAASPSARAAASPLLAWETSARRPASPPPLPALELRASQHEFARQMAEENERLRGRLMVAEAEAASPRAPSSGAAPMPHIPAGYLAAGHLPAGHAAVREIVSSPPPSGGGGGGSEGGALFRDGGPRMSPHRERPSGEVRLSATTSGSSHPYTRHTGMI